jgi:hypothetical protein
MCWEVLKFFLIVWSSLHLASRIAFLWMDSYEQFRDERNMSTVNEYPNRSLNLSFTSCSPSLILWIGFQYKLLKYNGCRYVNSEWSGYWMLESSAGFQLVTLYIFHFWHSCEKKSYLHKFKGTTYVRSKVIISAGDAFFWLYTPESPMEAETTLLCKIVEF